MALLGALGGAGVDGADDDAGRARPFGDAWGDRSITWRFPGWRQLDALSFAAPVWLASRLALLTIAAVIGRFLLEEAAAVLYPRRLQAVQDHGELPKPSTVQQVRGLVVRAGLLAFFAGAFLGNC